MGITEDSSSHDQLLEAFRNIALEKDNVDERDLHDAQLSSHARQYIAATLPEATEGSSGVRAFDCELPVLENGVVLMSTLPRSILLATNVRT